MTLKKQIGKVKQAYNDTLSIEPDEMAEVVHDIYAIDMDIDIAIRVIQNNERGRQGIARIQTIRKIIKNQEKEKKMRKNLQKGRQMEQSQQVKEAKAAEFLQKRFRGILARRTVEEMREDEMVFLGMKPRPQTAAELAADPVKAREETKNRAKMIQRANQNDYEKQRVELMKDITAVEGYDIKDKMLKERRDWITEHKGLFGKIPNDLEKFNARFSEEGPLSPEEEAAKAAAAEEDGKKKDKKKDKGKKKKKKGKGDKEDGGEDKVAKIGPNELVRKFDVFYDDYNNKWANRDETQNHDQKYDKSLARDSIMPEVQKTLTA